MWNFVFLKGHVFKKFENLAFPFIDWLTPSHLLFWIIWSIVEYNFKPFLDKHIRRDGLVIYSCTHVCISVFLLHRSEFQNLSQLILQKSVESGFYQERLYLTYFCQGFPEFEGQLIWWRFCFVVLLCVLSFLDGQSTFDFFILNVRQKEIWLCHLTYF